jgi:uncharacterized protein (DUF1684 family)
MVSRYAVLGLLVFLSSGMSGLAVESAGDYRAEIETFRKQREAALRAEDGWLSVVGLHWLRQGESRLGSDPASDILLPARAPAAVGTITLSGETASFQSAPGVKVMRAGEPFSAGEIRSDAAGKADMLELSGIKMILLRRGARHALRVKDSRSEARNTFAGLKWFPIDESWKVTAKFIPAPSQTRLVFDTIVGEQDVSESPGFVVFEREGKTFKLQAARESDGSLWLVFRDGTSGRTTAGNARQLIVPAPRDETVVLDFNKAINLPCSYIPYATCPLAPPQNRLSLPITAGEMKYEPNSTGQKSPAEVVE